MKALIFVEGTSDERLMKQYCQKLRDDRLINETIQFDIISLAGWTVIDSEQGQSARNNMKRNKDGKNLLIFDADLDPETRREEILAWKGKYGIDFELFLFPNDSESGTVETLLERIINPENQCIIDCWHQYEEQLSVQTIPWKRPAAPTCPSGKSMIYGYLEALVGTTNSEKDRIKDRNRDFTDSNHWDLESEGIHPLKEFLIKNLG